MVVNTALIQSKKKINTSTPRTTVDSLARIVSDLHYSKRFSTLSLHGLKELWKDASIHIQTQLHSNKSVHFPGLGYFHAPTTSTGTPFFQPSFTFDKTTTKKIQRNQKPSHQTFSQLEMLNFSAISREKGYSRDDAETGMKDLMLALVKVLTTTNGNDGDDGNNKVFVVLGLPKVGVLHIRFDNLLLNSSHTEPEHTTKPEKNQSIPSTPQHESNPDPTIKQPTLWLLETPLEKVKKTTLSQKPKVTVAPAVVSTSQQQPKPNDEQLVVSRVASSRSRGLSSAKNALEPLKNPPGGIALPPLRSKPECWTEEKSGYVPGMNMPNLTTSMTDDDSEFSFFFGLRSVKDYHTHQHSGNRLWSNAKCPLCLQMAIQPIEKNDEIKKRENENDRLFLNLSLEVDKEFIKRKKELESEHYKDNVRISEHNKQRAIEREKQRKEELIPKPMGNISDIRPHPPNRLMLNLANANDLLEQVARKKRLQEEEFHRKAIEDRISNSRFVQQFRKTTIEEYTSKVRKQNDEKACLIAQIEQKNSLKEPKNDQMENLFANNETPLFVQQRERAKKLYQEQIQILNQKKQYEVMVAELQKKTENDRLAIYKNRLEHDVKNMKRSRYEARKAMEQYWKQQIQFRKVNADPYAQE